MFLKVTILFRGPITQAISDHLESLVQDTLDGMNNRGFAALHSYEEIQAALNDVLSLKGYAGKPLM